MNRYDIIIENTITNYLKKELHKPLKKKKINEGFGEWLGNRIGEKLGNNSWIKKQAERLSSTMISDHYYAPLTKLYNRYIMEYPEIKTQAEQLIDKYKSVRPYSPEEASQYMQQAKQELDVLVRTAQAQQQGQQQQGQQQQGQQQGQQQQGQQQGQQQQGQQQGQQQQPQMNPTYQRYLPFIQNAINNSNYLFLNQEWFEYELRMNSVTCNKRVWAKIIKNANAIPTNSKEFYIAQYQTTINSLMSLDNGKNTKLLHSIKNILAQFTNQNLKQQVLQTFMQDIK